ncbi:hypothetical protein [Streptomyces sp. NBC_01171]|uniref:hypothetical protein n=1 Tax=Streptomyces sp. NBC_01171 TaxID=2903757 RepID=UPI003864A0D6|nr:hypothetical protein OG448_01375 [Streptomyces sp. NBC_01171]
MPPGPDAPPPPARAPTDLRFDGWITGIGTTSGTRLVLGHWPRSPFGPFSDVMVERADGHRTLLAPTRQVADFIAGTYSFDEVRVVPVGVRIAGDRWTVTSGPLLDLRFTVGRRGALGNLLRLAGPVTSRPAFAALTDPMARLLMGVRTRGSAGNGRYEWYGARDLHRLTAATATYEGRDLGPLTPVDPPVRFGFGSTPRMPCQVRVTTTVRTAG